MIGKRHYVAALVAIAMAVGIMACQGCATLGTAEGQAKVEQHQILFKAATQYATFKVIEKNPSMASEIARIAGETANLIDEGELVPLPVLEEIVREQIKWEKLTPEEFMLIDALISSVRLELQNAETSLNEDLSDGDAAKKQTLYYASVVLRWIEQAALMRSV